MTALVVLLGVGVQNIEYGTDIGANLTIMGFESVFGSGIPAVAVAICLTLFALSTVLTWALYGSRCVEYLFGFKVSKVYQVIFCLFACIAGTVELDLAWAIADTLNGLMAIPNLIALALLSPVVIKLSKEYFSSLKK
jgi:AGCS family alanine or glycine:cation symporter